MNSIRAKVVCVLWNSERMLLIQATDPHDGRAFLLPPGGGVEFGETLDQAVLREIFEEVGIQLPEAKRLGMLENVFQFAGSMEHELVFVYEAHCAEQAICRLDELVITESNGATFPARWYTLAEVAATGLPLFPEGLVGLLNASAARQG